MALVSDGHREPTTREIAAEATAMLAKAVKPDLSVLRKALQEALVVLDNIEALGIDHPCQIENIPIETTNRHVLEKAMGAIRYAMIRLCEKGVTSKTTIHRFADAIKASIVFPNG